MSEEKKSYYAIIPANVRYDKTLTPNAKLLYGEITALCNEKGYCWASNNYFAELYEVKPQAVSRWINLLADKGYLKLEYEYNGKEIKQRNIFIVDLSIKKEEVSIKSDEGINKNVKGYQYNRKDNNTINNTLGEEQFNHFYSQYPKKVDKTDSKKVFTSLLKKGITLQEIMLKLEIYKDREKNTELKYIRSPARFLRTLEDYELPTQQPKKEIEKTMYKCKKCDTILRDEICPKCFALHTIEGELV